jgi:hypothetical protein
MQKGRAAMGVTAETELTGRAALLDRLVTAETELLAAIEAVETAGPNASNQFDRQVAVIADAMGGVYRYAMIVDI